MFYNYGLALISQRVPGSSTNYFIFDGHGSTRMLTDAGGNFVNAFAYDAYGTLTNHSGCGANEKGTFGWLLAAATGIVGGGIERGRMPAAWSVCCRKRGLTSGGLTDSTKSTMEEHEKKN